MFFNTESTGDSGGPRSWGGGSGALERAVGDGDQGG